MGALPGGVPLHHGRHGAILHGGLPQSPGGAVPVQRGENQGELPAHARQRNQLQGLPLVGIVGGPANVMYCKKISDYARLKYQKR